MDETTVNQRVCTAIGSFPSLQSIAPIKQTNVARKSPLSFCRTSLVAVCCSAFFFGSSDHPWNMLRMPLNALRALAYTMKLLISLLSSNKYGNRWPQWRWNFIIYLKSCKGGVGFPWFSSVFQLCLIPVIILLHTTLMFNINNCKMMTWQSMVLTHCFFKGKLPFTGSRLSTLGGFQVAVSFSIWTFPRKVFFFARFAKMMEIYEMSKWHLALLRFFLFPTVPSWQKIPGWTHKTLGWGIKHLPGFQWQMLRFPGIPNQKNMDSSSSWWIKSPHLGRVPPASEVRAKSPRPQWIELQGTRLTKNSWKGRRGRGRFFEEVLKESHGITVNGISINLERFISGIHETNGKSTYMNGWFFMVFM